MKVFLLTLLTSIASAVKSSPKMLREDRDLRYGKSGKGGKGGKGSGGDLNCIDCFEELPGYSFFGQNFLEQGFYQDLFSGDLIDEIGDRGGPEFGTDFFVPGPLGRSTGGVTCYDNPITLTVCGVLTFLSEVIYTSDLLQCLFVNIVALLRNEVCEDERRSVPRDGMGLIPIPSLMESFLQGDLPSIGMGDIGSIYTMLGAPDLSAFMSAERRKLREEKTRELQISEDVDFLIDLLDNIPDSFVTTLTDNLFFVRCRDEGESLGFCALLFTLAKTLDASVCYYRDVLGCGAETCGKDTMFDIGYETERLALNLPFVPTEVAVVAAPCDGCLRSKTDGCSAFCSFYQGYHECNLAPILSARTPVTGSVTTAGVSPAEGYSYVPGYAESIAASGPERFPFN